MKWSTTPDGDCVHIRTPGIELECRRRCCGYGQSKWYPVVRFNDHVYSGNSFGDVSLEKCKLKTIEVALRVLHDTKESTAVLIDLVNTISNLERT